MLVLSRKIGEEIIINKGIAIKIIDIRSNTVKIGIEAPKDTTVLRKELVDGSR